MVEVYQGRLHSGGVARDYLGRLVPDGVSVLSNAKVVLGCGCHVFTGMRLDVQEPAYLAGPCSLRHRALIDRFQELSMQYPFKVGGSKSLPDHIADLLMEAESERSR
jgi:hypothetical protein